MLDIKEIEKILPHRYPFLMIDRIEEIQPLKYAKGYKNLTYNEEFFQGHFPSEPVMPGVLQIEAIAQVGACAILYHDDYKGKTAYFLTVNKAKFRRKVVPGDKLVIECTLTHFSNGRGIGEGKAFVDGEIACEAEVSFIVR